MRKIWKKGLSLVLAMILVLGMMPVTASAAVDSSGRPKDVNNSLVLSIYTGTGFPGEPAVYGTGDYRNFNSKFEIKSGATFASSADGQLDWDKIDKDIVEGAASGNTTVWGVYDANGTKDYFKSGASIISPENEIKMIRAVKNCSEEEAEKFEIIWYVIKLQHRAGWWSTTEWHIDGIIKEKAKISINYYGNGNTSGSAPLGTKDHTAGEPYTIKGVTDSNDPMRKKINGVEVAFLGWSAKADGTGAEAGFYQPGAVINPTQSISLYAMWDTTTQYTATVNTYMDGNLADEEDIHGTDRELYLSTDEEHYYKLDRTGEGVYSTKITGNGKFHLYQKNGDGTYTQVGDRQLTIYNQNGSMDVHHYSVTYDTNGDKFATEPKEQIYYYGNAVTAIADEPTKAGYRFLGWKMGTEGTDLIKPGEEVTASITAPIVLTAQWEKTVTVTVNVTIDHEGTSDGVNQAPGMEEVVLTVASRENALAPYIEVGKTLKLEKDGHDGFIYSEEKNDQGLVRTTKYEGYTLADMPGGATEYTVVTSKSGYETTVEHHKDADGNWVINVAMTYTPTNFDLTFNVTVAQDMPDAYVPKAAVVKVTFWAADEQRWKMITQEANGEPGVRVDFDPENRTATGSYPVWMYEHGDGEPVPYGYRVVVDAFIYPDNTIVHVNDHGATEKWTDGVYTANLKEVTGGQIYGTLGGAYYNDATQAQSGDLNVLITMDLHNVTFDAQGGKVNGQESQTVTDQYKIPSFKGYIPTREGGYTFGGWYMDETYTTPAVEGTDLTRDVTLYAKWIEPLTISGTVTISGTYQQNGETVKVHDIDKAKEAVVVLQELRNGVAVEIDSKTVSFGDYEDSASANYSFTGIPNEGKSYQIHVLELNYGTAYDNESDEGTSYSDDKEEYKAEFNGDSVADVDAYLQFVPPSYDQTLKVDATAISEAFRPKNVLSEVMYRDTGDNHPYHRISQHDVEPYGMLIGLSEGIGSGTQSIWKWHTDGTLYDYQMNVTKVDGVEFNSDTAPFYITYGEAAYWNATTNKPSGELKATLIPQKYLVTFEMDAGTDTITGMDAYRNSETGKYETTHTWSFDTAINVVPERAGYTFRGWEADVTGTYADGKIPANVAQNVVLKAKWEAIKSYTITTSVNNAERGETSGDGTYSHGATVTLRAVAKEGYSFEGWYDLKTGNRVTTDAEFTFTAEADKDFLARFYKNSTYKNRYAYILGYSDTVMGADGPLRRGELAGMIYRLAKQNGQLDKSETDKFIYDKDNPSFTDISGEWFQCAIEYMQYRGGISTPAGQSVNGYVQVTRGEAFKMVALGLGFTKDTTLTRTQYGELLAEFGYIVGMNGSGDLDTGSLMNRAQFVTLYNRIIGRSNALLVDAQGNEITHETYGFTDLASGEWYYEDMLRGTSAYTEDGFVSLEDRAIRNDVDDYN